MTDHNKQGAASADATEAQIVAAARALSDMAAEACNVDKDDNWKFYGDGFREDARVALVAALAASPQEAQPQTTLRALIADDGFAMSFQSMGQYRTALLAATPAAEVAVAPQADDTLQGAIKRLPQNMARWSKEAEMMRSWAQAEQVAKAAPLTEADVLEILLDGDFSKAGADKLRNGDDVRVNLEELTSLANEARRGILGATQPSIPASSEQVGGALVAKPDDLRAAFTLFKNCHGTTLADSTQGYYEAAAKVFAFVESVLATPTTQEGSDK